MKKIVSATAAALICLPTTSTWALDLVTNGDFESGGFSSASSVNADTGVFGEWLATGSWTMTSGGVASNTSNVAQNPGYNYIMMQGISLSSFTSPFQAVLAFDYVYEGGFGGLDGRGIRLFGMDAGETVSKFFTSTTFDAVTDDTLFSQVLPITGNPSSSFTHFSTGPIMIDPSQYNSLLLVFTFGGSPTSGEIRAVDNVSLSTPGGSVPAPGPLGLFAVGLAAVAWRRRSAAAS